MKIYFGIKYYENFSNKKKIETIIKILEQKDHKIYCVVRDLEEWGKHEFTAKELMIETFNQIDKSDLVLIEFSEKGTGLGIEAGYAYAKYKPIIVIAEEGSDISTTIQGIATKIIMYKDIEWLNKTITKELIYK